MALNVGEMENDFYNQLKIGLDLYRSFKAHALNQHFCAKSKINFTDKSILSQVTNISYWILSSLIFDFIVRLKH